MKTEHLAVFLLFAPLANLNPKVNLCCRQNHAYKLHDEITTTKIHHCDPEPQVDSVLTCLYLSIIIAYLKPIYQLLLLSEVVSNIKPAGYSAVKSDSQIEIECSELSAQC